MVMVNFTIKMVVCMMEIGDRIKCKVSVNYSINLVS